MSILGGLRCEGFCRGMLRPNTIQGTQNRDSGRVAGPDSLCYPSSIMVGSRSNRKSGRIRKISISLDQKPLAILRARASHKHDGNVSAAVAEGARLLKLEEGRDV